MTSSIFTEVENHTYFFDTWDHHSSSTSTRMSPLSGRHRRRVDSLMNVRIFIESYYRYGIFSKIYICILYLVCSLVSTLEFSFYGFSSIRRGDPSSWIPFFLHTEVSHFETLATLLGISLRKKRSNRKSSRSSNQGTSRRNWGISIT